jgi:hypothetical protein
LRDSREYPSIDDLTEFDRRLVALEKIDEVADRLLDDELQTDEDFADGPVSKRPFCNGFTGCGRLRGKRLSPNLLESFRLSNSSPESVHETPSDPAPRTKRPFCNGFFGCGNPGKRLMFRNAPKGYRRNVAGEKRFFCNPGAFGCGNPNKRNSLLDRMRTAIDSDE